MSTFLPPCSPFKRLFLFSTACLLVAVSLLLPKQSVGQCVVSQTDDVNTIPYEGVGQSFVATCDGLLESISIYVESYESPEQTLKLVRGENINDLEFWTANANITRSGLVTFVFPTPVPVIANRKYTFMVDDLNGSVLVNNNVYADGSVYKKYKVSYENEEGYYSYDVREMDPTMDLKFSVTISEGYPTKCREVRPTASLEVTSCKGEFIGVGFGATLPLSQFSWQHFDSNSETWVTIQDTGNYLATQTTFLIISATNESYSGEYRALMYGDNCVDTTGIFTINVVENTLKIESIVTSFSDCPVGGERGTAKAVVSGGVEPYIYNWDHDQVPAGDYTDNIYDIPYVQHSLTVSDPSGCSVTKDFKLDAPDFCLVGPEDMVINLEEGECGRKLCYEPVRGWEPAQPITPAGYYFLGVYNGNYYYVSESYSTWTDARDNAAAAGGHLWVPNSPDELFYVKDFVPGTVVWAGMTDEVTEGEFVAVTCQDNCYYRWKQDEDGSEPNNSPNDAIGEDYVVVDNDYTYNDASNNYLKYSILEVEGARITQISGLPQNSTFPIGVTTNTFQMVDSRGDTLLYSFKVRVNGAGVEVLEQPKDAVSCGIDNVVIGVKANNAISYQWQQSATGQPDTYSNIADGIDGVGTEYSGANTDTLIIKNVVPKNNFKYRCLIKGEDCLVESRRSVLSISPFLLSATITNNICYGGTNGVLSLDAGIGATYSWNTNPISTSNTIENLAAGDYICSVTNAYGCTEDRTFTIGEGKEITVETTINDASCNGMDNGEIKLDVSGGRPLKEFSPFGGGGLYLYSWNGGPNSITPVWSGLTAGNYTCTITDANDCSVEKVFSVGEPDAIDVQLADINVCAVEEMIRLTQGTPEGGYYAGAGVVDAQYLMPRSIDPEFRTVSYIVTDPDNGCRYTASKEVQVNEPPSAEITSGNGTPNFCEAEGALKLSVPDNYESYAWYKDGVELIDSTDNDIAVLQAGSYKVKLEANGCFGYTPEIVVAGEETPSGLTVHANKPLDICFGETIKLTASVASTYQWMRNGVDIPNATQSSYTTNLPGIYQVKAGDGEGCAALSGVLTVNIKKADKLMVEASATEFCKGESVLITGSSDFVNYSWRKNGIPIPDSYQSSLTVTEGGSYSLKAIGENGCAAVSSPVKIVMNKLPNLNLNHPWINNVCEGQTLELAVAEEATSYQWTNNDIDIPGATNSSYVVTQDGSYRVKIMNEKGCQGISYASVVFMKPVPETPTVKFVADSLLATTTIAEHYQWFKNGSPISGATSTTYKIESNGNYFLVVANNWGCGEKSNEVNMINLAMEKTEEKSVKVQVYPNPVSDQVFVDVSMEAKYSLYDLNGRMILKGDLKEGKNHLNTLELAKGVYQLGVLLNSGEYKVIKLIK